ncbi:MAG: glycosyltransferase family 9 protein [Candidatus Binatia bacterium]
MSMKSMGPRVRPKIGVIFPGALGDFICFLPVLQTLARGARVDLFARSEFAELTPKSVTVRTMESSAITVLFRAELGMDEEAKRFFRGYDAVYSWFASGHQEFVRRLQVMTGGVARVFPFRPARIEGHQADFYLSCLNHAGDSAEPMVTIRPEALRWCEEFWVRHALHQRAVLTIAPGSGAREKNWPAEFFLAVSQWWREATGGVVLLLIGPVEQERGGIELLRSNCVVASDLNLSQAAALLRRSDVYLGNDSGVSHLAAATGVRTVALFGPSDPRQWAPRGKRVIVLRRNLDCSPCQDATIKTCPHHACLTEFLPGEVIATLAQLPEVVTLTR